MARCIDIVWCLGLTDPMAPKASPTSMSADSSTSRSHRSNSCVKQLQHHATIVENEVDGWRLWSTEHRALTDGASDRQEMDISSLAASITTTGWTHKTVVWGDAIGGGWMVLVGGGRGGGVVAMVFACFHRDDKSVPKFWYVLNGFLPENGGRSTILWDDMNRQWKKSAWCIFLVVPLVRLLMPSFWNLGRKLIQTCRWILVS